MNTMNKNYYYVDLTGQKYGRLSVIKMAGRDKWGAVTWCVKCDCGTEKILSSGVLRHGNTQSCGCYLREQKRELCINRNTTHGLTYSRSYIAWSHMLARCNNKKDKHYKRYGGRGIKVCDRWLNFENFYADMGDRPTSLHSIDRIDNNGNYEPGNCRWTTLEVQANNRSNNRLISFNGKTKTVNEWARALNIKYGTLHSRFKRGWSIEKSLTAPLRQWPK